MSSSAQAWATRLAWRMRGAWAWPAFGALTLADGLIIHLLPPTRTGVGLIPGVIIASFGNLILVGAIAPWIARRLEARRPANGQANGGVPYEVVLDRVATAVLVLGAVGLVAAGLATQPLVVSETEATEKNARVIREHVLASGHEELVRNLETANTIRLDEGFFRTCLAADDRRRAHCFFVDTSAEPPTLRRDPSTVPNSEFRR